MSQAASSASLPEGTRRKQGDFGVLFKGLPDNRTARVALSSTGSPTVVMPNRIVLSAGMENVLAHKGKTIWLPAQKPLSIPNVGWIVNSMADADEYETALGHLARTTRGLSLPVLNPAEGILRTRRDRAPELLDGIDGLMIPRCVRFSPTRPAHFREIFEREEFQYPVMIRPERSQTAAGLIRVMDEADWDKIYEIPWIGASSYMTQWVDYRQVSGWYAKARIVVAGERISVRHILRSREWLIHAMERTEESAAWELPYLEGAGQWEAVQRIGRAVRKRFGLDFFGIDVGMIDENSFVLFEANAAMSILSDYMMPEIRKTEFLANLRRIERDVIAALASKGVPVTAEAASF